MAINISTSSTPCSDIKSLSAHSFPQCRIKQNTNNPTQIITALPPLKILPLLQNPPKPKPRIKSTHPITTSKKRNSTTDADATVLDILRLMDGLNFSISQDVYTYLIKECTHLRDPVMGVQVHSHITQSGYQPALLLANRLLFMYVSCGCLDSAHQLFDEMLVRDSISWTTMIAGHVDNEEYYEALILFKEMQQHRHQVVEESLWGLIINCVLQACIHANDMDLGKQVHGYVLKSKNVDDLLLGSLFINLYGKLGCLRSARCVFDNLKKRDTVIWTSMIVVYSKAEHYKEVLELFKEMGRVGAKRNNFTFSSVIRACGRMGDVRSGRQLHASVTKLGVALDLFVLCSLVDMYGKCGLMNDAKRMFEMCKDLGDGDGRNDVCWNAMLTGYAQNGFYNEAIKFLYRMKSAGVQPPESLLNQVRADCAN